MHAIHVPQIINEVGGTEPGIAVGHKMRCGQKWFATRWIAHNCTGRRWQYGLDGGHYSVEGEKVIWSLEMRAKINDRNVWKWAKAVWCALNAGGMALLSAPFVLHILKSPDHEDGILVHLRRWPWLYRPLHIDHVNAVCGRQASALNTSAAAENVQPAHVWQPNG